MKKSLKITIIIIVIIVGIIVLDTIQAKMFDNSPLLKIREYYNGGNIKDGTNLYCVDNGILVKAYQYGNGHRNVVFRWEKYNNSIGNE